MNAFRTAAAVLAIVASSATLAQAADGKAPGAAPARQETFLSLTLKRLHAEQRAALRRDSHEALVTLRSQGASALANGAQEGVSPSIKSGF
ncbi:MAG TPA: hypothetical protein VM074_00115 [Solimonas sp.]|nr:hypothetical protein [Solimonas sp.]